MKYQGESDINNNFLGFRETKSYTKQHNPEHGSVMLNKNLKILKKHVD